MKNFLKKIRILFFIYLLKFYWNKLNKYIKKQDEKIRLLKCYETLFIKDVEDRKLNQKYIHKEFVAPISKYNTKKQKTQIKINRIFYKSKFLYNQEEFLKECVELNISSDKISFMRSLICYLFNNK